MISGEMLKVVIFALIFGIALVNMNPKRSRPLIELMGSLQDVCMTIVKWAMLLAPLAVFGLMTKLTSQLGLDALLGTSIYVLTVLLGLGLLLLFYLFIIFIVSGIHPKEFLTSARDVQLLAFSTSSSAAVMPLSIKTAEEKFKVRPSIAQFVVPIGATVNMDGTALYQGIATVFLAQVFGVDLALTALLFLIVTIVGASIGSPATPGVGIVILAVALNAIGIPVAGIALILGVDRILDMCRTSINVTGDLTACILMNKIMKGGKSANEEIDEQTKLEVMRTKIGRDVLIHKVAS
jgi:Na+/H+-dicarboxylate symporter